MSKDIYFNNRIFTNVPADELILDYIARMHDKGLRYDTMGSYEVLNAPVDWIDGKEVTGLWEFEPSHPDNKVIYARAIKHYKSDATGGRMSKTNYDTDTMRRVMQDYQQESHYETIKTDILEMVKDGADLKEVIEYVKSL